jgi:acetyltransferase-like isoleucine patch superfamily enzyme
VVGDSVVVGAGVVVASGVVVGAGVVAASMQGNAAKAPGKSPTP